MTEFRTLAAYVGGYGLLALAVVAAAADLLNLVSVEGVYLVVAIVAGVSMLPESANPWCRVRERIGG